MQIKRIKEIHVDAKGVDCVCLSQGRGPLVLMVHGFPDIPQTWSEQMNALSAAGYHVVAPYLPGYFPSLHREQTFFDKASLVHFFSKLIEALSPSEKVYFVGQDWGAIIGYALSAARPDLLRSSVLMAVPHPDVVANYLLVPKHIHRSFHWWFFQQKELPEKALLANDMALIDYLWEYWTTPGYRDVDHVREIKQYLQHEGVLSNALAYYRAMFNHELADPALKTLREQLLQKIALPTLALCGADDMRAELMREQAEYFTGVYEYLEIPEAGHFLHREQSQTINQALIEWLAKTF